jgi:hypothetical protein
LATDVLGAIQEHLGGLVRESWASEMHTRGQRVAKYRRYYDGEHEMKLTTEMKLMFRISDDQAQEFNDNYCQMIVDKKVDRMTVSAVSGDSDEGTAWSAGLLNQNRFDALQHDVNRAKIRDGESFVMVSWDNDSEFARFTHELAWDDDYGCIAIYDRARQNVLAVAKVWYEGEEQAVNLYWPDKAEKLIAVEVTEKDEAGNDVTRMILQAREELPVEWQMRDGEPVGVPFVHFRNMQQSQSDGGVSEIKTIIPLNDALNRTLMSMVMTSELTAFGVRIAKGFLPDAKIAPGIWVAFGYGKANADGSYEPPPDAAELGAMDAYMMEQGEITAFIGQAGWLIDQIGTISGTPLPSSMGGDSQSGEALKQRESALLAKVKQDQTTTGNSWEDVLGLAARVQMAFGKKQPPVVLAWSCQWKDAQVRNAKEMVEIVLMIRRENLIPAEEVLRLIANLVPEFNWDEKRVKDLAAEVAAEKANQLLSLADRLGQNRAA